MNIMYPMLVVLFSGDEPVAARLLTQQSSVEDAFPGIGSVRMIGGSSALWKSAGGEDRYLPVLCYRKED